MVACLLIRLTFYVNLLFGEFVNTNVDNNNSNKYVQNNVGHVSGVAAQRSRRRLLHRVLFYLS